jgi:hypothetical protein
MSWAHHAKEALGRGETAQVRPRGHSMRGKVDDGDLVTLEPCDPADVSTLVQSERRGLRRARRGVLISSRLRMNQRRDSDGSG